MSYNNKCNNLQGWYKNNDKGNRINMTPMRTQSDSVRYIISWSFYLVFSIWCARTFSSQSFKVLINVCHVHSSPPPASHSSRIFVLILSAFPRNSFSMLLTRTPLSSFRRSVPNILYLVPTFSGILSRRSCGNVGALSVGKDIILGQSRKLTGEISLSVMLVVKSYAGLLLKGFLGSPFLVNVCSKRSTWTLHYHLILVCELYSIIYTMHVYAQSHFPYLTTSTMSALFTCIYLVCWTRRVKSGLYMSFRNLKTYIAVTVEATYYMWLSSSS